MGGPASFHSDVYALGCVVYELFTGHAPFRGATPVATLLMHLHDDLPLGGEDAEHIPPPLVPILKRALAKDPDERYASVSDFAEAITAARPPRAGSPALPPRRAAPAVRATAPGARRGRARRAAVRSAHLAVGDRGAGDRDGGSRRCSPSCVRRRIPLPVPVTMPSPVPHSRGRHRVGAGDSPSRRRALDAVGLTARARGGSTTLHAADRPSPPRGRRRSTGILRLLVVPESRVSLDGTSLGLVSRRELPLSPGTHTVRVEHPDYQPLQRRVTIREGVTGEPGDRPGRKRNPAESVAHRLRLA